MDTTDLSLKLMHKLDDAGKEMLLHYYVGLHVSSEYHFIKGVTLIRKVNAVLEQNGIALTEPAIELV